MNLRTSALHPLRRIFRGIRNKWSAYRKRKADFGAHRRWLKHHPSGNFKEFYVDTIKGCLTGEGGPHSTLGPHPIWEKQGDEILRQLIELGLRPGDVVVDYGCGTLREGIHLIRYLDAGRYIGLDVDERVLDAGRRLVGQELLAEKKPRLAIINPPLVAQAAAERPAWIISSYVLSQMPPEHLDEYFDNLAKLTQGGGKAALQVRLAWRTMQYSRTGWYHNRRRVARSLAKLGLKVLQMKTRQLTSKPYKVRGTEVRLIVGRKQPHR
jgi:SAM-dependent methyltransferase